MPHVRGALLEYLVLLLLLLLCVLADEGQHRSRQLVHGTAAAEGVVGPLQHHQRVALQATQQTHM